MLLSAWVPAQAADPGLPVVGAVETVRVGNPPVEFEARIDTGADISSIDASEITRTRRERRQWIDFVVARADGKRFRMSAPLVRHARIRQGGTLAGRRPVVLLDICLGSRSRTVEVSLADRVGMDYDVLVGRNVLSGYFVVDPARDHALPPACAQRSGE